MSYETTEAAKERKDKELNSTKRKSHEGNLELATWNKEILKAEVEGFEDGRTVNWSELARKHNVLHNVLDTKKGKHAANGGQTVKEWLIPP